MGDGSKFVIDRYPAEKLPEDLRRGIESGRLVRVTVEPVSTGDQPLRSLTSFVGATQGAYPSPEDAVASIRTLREEWK